jgi:hypothetical protein
MVHRWIFGSHGNDLVIFIAGVDHLHVADNGCFYQAQRLNGLRAQHQNIQRIVVLPQCLRNKAVIDGIVKRGMDNAIQFQQAGFFINLVFGARALRNFNQVHLQFPVSYRHRWRHARGAAHLWYA